MDKQSNLLISELKKELASLTANLPKKETPEYLISKRETVKVLTNELMSISKTSKVVKAYLQNCDLDCFKSMIKPENREAIFNDRYPQLVKSVTLVIKSMTDKQRTAFITEGNTCTPSTYLSAIERALKMSAKKWNETTGKKAK